jgi:muramoyltetrapeptide carboxypeptidase
VSGMRKPRALRPGDRLAIVAPASAFSRDDLEPGLAELRALGFDPVYDARILERRRYLAGDAETRADVFQQAWEDPSVAGLVAVRGGYGSVQLLPLLDAARVSANPKAFVGYSDNTSLLSWLTLTCGIVTFHGPMIDRRLSRGAAGYDRDSFLRCLTRPVPVGEIADPRIEALAGGEAAGMLTGGTLTQLAASLGTPYAFDPPDGCVLFLEDVAERPYRLDRMLTQLRQSGILGRASALLFGEMSRCDEPDGPPTARDVIVDLVAGFRGPVLYGVPSGHTSGPTLTLPFGVRARVVAGERPRLVIEESAVI